MSRLLSSLLFASLLPACLTELDGTELETTDVAQELLTSGSTRLSPTRIIPVGDTINAYGMQSSLRARLLDANGNGLAGRTVGAQIGARTFFGVTDANGMVDIENTFEVLGVPQQHTVTWKFYGADYYAASTASSKLSIIRSDCRVTYVTSRYEDGKHKIDAGWARRRGANEWANGYQDLEINNNGAFVGTLSTSTFGIETTPSANTGTLWATFPGDAYYAPCASSAPYMLIEPLGKITVSSNLSEATIGASTLTLTVRSYVLDGTMFEPRPNTKVRLYAEPVHDDDLNLPLGSVTTNANGVAVLSVPINTNFHGNTWKIEAHSDDPFEYMDLSQPLYPTVVIHKGTVELEHIVLSMSGDPVTDVAVMTSKWIAREASKGTLLPGLLLKGPCPDMVTKADGSFTCTHKYSLWFDNSTMAKQVDRWNTVSP